jgi:hypothetical protein
MSSTVFAGIPREDIHPEVVLTNSEAIVWTKEEGKVRIATSCDFTDISQKDDHVRVAFNRRITKGSTFVVRSKDDFQRCRVTEVQTL